MVAEKFKVDKSTVYKKFSERFANIYYYMRKAIEENSSKE